MFKNKNSRKKYAQFLNMLRNINNIMIKYKYILLRQKSIFISVF